MLTSARLRGSRRSGKVSCKTRAKPLGRITPGYYPPRFSSTVCTGNGLSTT